MGDSQSNVFFLNNELELNKINTRIDALNAVKLDLVKSNVVEKDEDKKLVTRLLLSNSMTNSPN